MLNFTYYNPTRIIFGKDTITQVGEHVSQFAQKVLLHYGGGSIKRNGVYEQVISSLKRAHIDVIELSGVVPNPRLSKVVEGIEIVKKEKISFILAVGGGSVIDSAKAIAIGSLLDGENLWNDYFLTSTKEIEKALPVGVVLTIPASGSESSTGSVITDDKSNLKRPIKSEHIIPRFAIMDPQTNYSLPDYQTACGSSDILAHLMERYFTNEVNNDLSDKLLESAMRNVIAYAPLALKHPTDYRYRSELMWSGTLAHNNLLDRGRVSDWASHAIEHELSGVYDIAHGAGLSIIFPAWMRYVYTRNIDRFVQFGVRVCNVNLTLDDKDVIVEAAIDRLELFYRSLGLPVRLTDAGIGTEKIDLMSKNATLNKKTIGNFFPLTSDDVKQILRLAL